MSGCAQHPGPALEMPEGQDGVFVAPHDERGDTGGTDTGRERSPPPTLDPGDGAERTQHVEKGFCASRTLCQVETTLHAGGRGETRVVIHGVFGPLRPLAAGPQ